MTIDPIGFAGKHINLYGFVDNNPIAIIDPLGLECVRLVMYADHYKTSNVHTFKNAATVRLRYYKARNEPGVKVLEAPRKGGGPPLFVRTGQEIVKFINDQHDDSILSLDIYSHGNQAGIHISKKFTDEGLQPVRHNRWTPWGFLKPRVHTLVRGYPEEEGVEMEEFYHGLYTNVLYGRLVGWYFNQVPSKGIAYLRDIDFDKFSNDARVEFHGCKTAQKLAIHGIPMLWDNFAQQFSERLYGAYKWNATVIGHVGRSGPPEKCAQYGGNCPPGFGFPGYGYEYGPRRVYQRGKVKEEIDMEDTPEWFDFWPGR